MSEKIDALDIQIETSLGNNTTKEIRQASNAIKKLAENLKGVDTSALEKVSNAFKGSNAISAYAKSMKEVSSSIRSLSKIDVNSLNNAKKTLKEISDLDFDFSSFADLKNIDFSGLSKFGRSLDTVRRKAKQTQADLRPIEERMTISYGDEFTGSNEAPVTNAPKTKSNVQYQKFDTEAIEEYVNNFDKGNLTLKEFRERLKGLSAPKIDTTDIKKLERDLATAERRLEALNTKADNDTVMGKKEDSKQMMNQERKIRETELLIGALKARIEELNNSPVRINAQRLEAFNKVATRLLGVLVKLRAGLKGFIGNMAKSALSFARNKAQALDFHKSLGVGFKVFMKYGLAIRSTFFLLKKLRGEFGAAMNNLVQYSAQANTAVSAMYNSLNALRNSLGTAFAPIINVIAPYISALIDMLTDGMNAIAQFFAAITGAKTVVLAQKTNKNYAASLSDVGSSASDSANGVKELAESLDLLNFDEINKLSEPSKGSGSSGGSGGSGGGSGVAGMFTTQEVDSAFANIADMFKNGEWWQIGEIIANGINEGLGKIDALISWENVGEKITNICHGITTILNSTIANMDWSLAGKTFGDGINTVVNTINLIYDGINWENLGKSLGAGVNKMVSTVDWSNVGKAFTQNLKALVESASSFFNTVDGSAVGKAIANFLSGAIKNVNIKKVKDTLVGALNTLGDALESFVDEIDWDTAKQEFTDAFVGFFTEVDFVKIGQGIGELVAGVAGMILNPSNILALFDAGVKLIAGFIDGLLSGIGGGIWDTIKKVFGNIGSVPAGAELGIPVNLYAEGKIDTSNVSTPTMNSTLNANKLNDKIPSSKKYIGGTLNANNLKDVIPSSKRYVTGQYKVNDYNNANKNVYAAGQYKVNANITKRTNGKNIEAQGGFRVSNLVGTIGTKLKNLFGLKANGGIYSNGSWKNIPQFAGGGIINQGGFGRFAGGGLPMHGTAFVAGESGSEIVGNINGRTEVLNQSQIASAIYSAMIQAMKQQNVNVNVSLQGDANTMFKVVQNKAKQYTVQTGKMPFAY